MADGSLSDKKRSRLQALESRLSSSSSPLKKSTNTPLPRLNSSLKPPATSTVTPPTAAAATGDFQGPAYAKLSKLIIDGPIASCLQLTTEDNGRLVIDSILRELVQDSGKVVRDLDGVLDSRVQDRVLLLDNPAGHGKAVERARRRAIQSLANRSSKHLSRHQQKLIGSYNLPLEYQKFSLFQPMHELWRAYAKEALHNSSGKMIEPSVLQLDLHGAYLAVVQAKIDNQVGVEGIMIRETANTLALITKNDTLKVIPKTSSVFVFRLDNMCVTVYGDRMSSGKGAAFGKS
ncbi:hypothetical protein GOP47_0024926 [Adiantum capillus-veneris]|uniref:Uncharacterized protein n=1 Tax=Adiantum capillus-veneris TaxID=13818 RepID=A0A9D4Z5H7_ADICA|nr:hypothetical protein GOP47_0024926 [Adiantum capillus-veneris]